MTVISQNVYSQCFSVFRHGSATTTHKNRNIRVPTNSLSANCGSLVSQYRESSTWMSLPPTTEREAFRDLLFDRPLTATRKYATSKFDSDVAERERIPESADNGAAGAQDGLTGSSLLLLSLLLEVLVFRCGQLRFARESTEAARDPNVHKRSSPRGDETHVCGDTAHARCWTPPTITNQQIET